MRNKDFIASPDRVQKGENSHGFRAVTAAEDVTDNPFPRQDCHVGPNVNGDYWTQFPCVVDAAPKMKAPSKRLGRGR